VLFKVVAAVRFAIAAESLRSCAVSGERGSICANVYDECSPVSSVKHC
jgi:hypothetical protein